jgi:hypothetical protein
MTPPNPNRKPRLYVVTVGGQYVGSPTNTRTPNRQLAATWREADKHEAETLAQHIGGQAQPLDSNTTP